MDAVRKYGPVTIGQVVAICGPMVKPEMGRRRALSFHNTEANAKYMSSRTNSQQIEVGRMRLITRIVCDLHRFGKIKRLGGKMKTKQSEWVLSDWSFLEKGTSDVSPCG